MLQEPRADCANYFEFGFVFWLIEPADIFFELQLMIEQGDTEDCSLL
jgi:hypothetical protein